MASLIVASTFCCRGVSPVASGGPSGSSATFFFGMADSVPRRGARFQTPVRRRVARSGRADALRDDADLREAEPFVDGPAERAGVQDGVGAAALAAEVHQ